ncbi:MFS transporter [Roseateles cellulosilyticus]|uniref:MFS transporter n=1 Tax=Pelomonas cellulosilytica TaxID=2906762 RepID=A0ABS8XZ61_9BURK|nr:MFS transporter [Pelomonas sp. P8]MCE4556570.1 MFS transporter [Pelomonas sp. P8]
MASLPNIDLAERLDRLPVTQLHVMAMLMCGMGMMIDTLEMAFGGVLGTVFSTQSPPVPPVELGLLLSAVFVGAVIGAPLLGWWADRQGRRVALVGVMLWICVASLGAAIADGVGQLTLCRLLGGLALGGYPPIVIAYLTDLLPPQRRASLIFLSLTPALLGPPAAIFMVRWLAPLQPLGLEGWRWGFFVGSACALLSAVSFFALPESPRWLLARGRAAKAEAVLQHFERSAAVLAMPPVSPGAAASGEAPSAANTAPAIPMLWRWLAVVGLFLLSPWATIAFPLLTGAVLAQRGFKLDAALLIFGLSSMGPLMGTLVASTVMDRLDRRLAMATCVVAMLACGTAFNFSTGTAALIVAMGLFNLSVALYVPLLTVYSAELFPTGQRASASAIAWAINRLGGALGPLLLVPTLRGAGPSVMFAVVAVSLLATLAVLAASPPGLERQAVS